MVFVFLGTALTSFPTSILAGQLSETDKPFPTPFGQCAKSLKSGHIIFNCFGDWSVRKVFKSGRKEHRYSDMKTKMRMSNGVEVTFQINRRASDGDWSVILGAWIDRVEFEIGGEVINVKASMKAHTYYGNPDIDFYHSFARAKGDIKVRVHTNGKIYSGRISYKGADKALKYLGLNTSP